MTQFIEKISALAKEFADPELDRQVQEIKMIDECVSSQRMLLFAPDRLGISDDRFAELTWELLDSQIKDLRALNNLLNNVRQYLSLEYGIWSLPNMETAQLFKNELGIETALEVMAGNAYWSKALSEAGIQVWATDSLEWSKSSKTGKKPLYPVENLPADQAVMKYATCDMILCSGRRISARRFGTDRCQAALRSSCPPLFHRGKRGDQFPGILDQKAFRQIKRTEKD